MYVCMYVSVYLTCDIEIHTHTNRYITHKCTYQYHSIKGIVHSYQKVFAS